MYHYTVYVDDCDWAIIIFNIEKLYENKQGRPKGKAAQARALDPQKNIFFIKDIGPKKKSLNCIYIYI
jgi:hypothetical protein